MLELGARARVLAHACRAWISTYRRSRRRDRRERRRLVAWLLCYWRSGRNWRTGGWSGAAPFTDHALARSGPCGRPLAFVANRRGTGCIIAVAVYRSGGKESASRFPGRGKTLMKKRIFTQNRVPAF